MTVVWVDLVSELGGAQRSMLEICSALPAFGVKVVAAVPRGPLFDLLSAAGIAVYPLSPVRATKRGWGFFMTTAKLLKAPSSVAQIIRTVKPDVVHANSLPAFMAASRATHKIPVFWHVRDLRLPAIIARDAAKRAARIIAASEAIDEHLVDILSPRILGRIRVIRNGIDVARFKPGAPSAARQAFGLPQEVPVIGMIAHLIPWKRHDAFIQAAALIRNKRPDAVFVAVGRDLFGEHKRWTLQLEALVAQNNLTDCFRWIRDLDTVETILPAFDLLLHPALNEPFGRVICEALVANVPVIAAASGGPATIIKNGVSGILVRGGDPQFMAEEALALLANPERAAKLAAAGHNRVLEQFTTHHVCEQLVSEYRAALAATKVRSDGDDD
jgi:glycosyltransferase involved in cell wall biosynthesis